MPILKVNTPFESADPAITVEIDRAAPLGRGRHRYQLSVTDDSGNISEPVTVIVIVADQTRPTAVLNAPDVVNIGAEFRLDGRRSFDIGGDVKSWTFTYLGPVVT
jgi:hypothetical protein